MKKCQISEENLFFDNLSDFPKFIHSFEEVFCDKISKFGENPTENFSVPQK